MARQVTKPVDVRDVGLIKTATKTGTLSKAIQDFTQAMTLRAEANKLTTRADQLKASLKAYVGMAGTVDPDKGHRTIEFAEPVTVDGVTFLAMVNQQRKSTYLDTEASTDILNELGLWQDAIETIEVIDQDKVLGLYQDGKLTDDHIASMFKTDITWAFTPVKK